MLIKRIIAVIICLINSTFLNSQSPSLQWAKSYGNSTGSEDSPGMTTDVFGNVYVIGDFRNTVDFDPGPGVYNLTSSGGSYDAFITKFDASGNFLWAKSFFGSGQYDVAISITTDNLGNVYSTGRYEATTDFDPGIGVFNLSCSGNYDAFISKLDASGNFVWAKKLGTNLDEEGRTIILDATNNVFVTGVFGGTCDFDPGIGTYNMTSNNGADMFVLKLDASGNFVWAKSANGAPAASSISSGRKILLDGSNNIYVTGNFYGTTDFDPGAGSYTLTSTSNSNAFILKLDTLGNFIWVKQIAGISVGASSMVLDNFGNSYTTGSFSGTTDFDPSTSVYNLYSAGGYDGYILKLNSNGDFVWAKQIGGTGYDEIRPIALDSWGDIYFGGQFESIVDFDPGIGTYTISSNGNTDLFLTKLDSSGFFTWAKTIGGSQSEYVSFSLLLDGAGSIYSNGSFQSVVDFDPNAPVFNMNSLGGYDVFLYKLNQCITPPPPVNTTSLINQTFCANQTITLTAIASSTINWFSSATSSIILGTGSTFLTPALSAGTYTYYAESIVCLPSITRTPIIVTVYSLPSVTVSSALSLICSGQTVTLTANGANTYSWNPGGAGTTIAVSPTTTTNYTVTGTDANGCKNNAIITQSVSLCTGIISSINKTGSEILIYPNPNNGNFVVELSSPSQIIIYNTLGQIIYEQNQKELKSNISLLNHSNGIYFIHVLDKEKIISSGKIIKN